MDYKNAGVDIEAGYKSVELMKEHIKRTMRPEVLNGIGGFSGAFSMEAFKNMEQPTLVSGPENFHRTLHSAQYHPDCSAHQNASLYKLFWFHRPISSFLQSFHR